jgi:hypothetical protein
MYTFSCPLETVCWMFLHPQVTRERDAVKSSNKDLELTVEAMNAALSINKARSKPSSFFGRSSMDRMLPVMSVDMTALASAADAAMNPSPVSTVTSQDAATAEAVSSPFAGVGASAGTLASKPVSAVDNMVSAVTGALLGPSFAGAPQTPRGISLSVSFGSSPARSVPPSPLVSRSASNTSLPAPPSIDTPVSVALGPRSPVDLCLDVVSVDIRVASLAGNQSSGAPSTEALPPVTSTQSSQRAPTPESFELSPTIASVHVAGESPTSPGTLSALPLAVDTRVANPESVTLDSARGRSAVDHEKCVNDLAAVTSQVWNVCTLSCTDIFQCVLWQSTLHTAVSERQVGACRHNCIHSQHPCHGQECWFCFVCLCSCARWRSLL